MLKQVLSLIRSSPLFPRGVTLLFYGFVFLVIAGSKLPTHPDEAFTLRQRFGENQRQYFPDPGEIFSIFAPYVPQKGSLSFITDSAYEPYDLEIAQHFSAQNYFTPLILNPFPQEKYALVYCSGDSVAAARLRETGYRMRAVLAPGKGLAEKIS